MKIEDIQNPKFKNTVKWMEQSTSLQARTRTALVNSADDDELSANLQAELLEITQFVNQTLRAIRVTTGVVVE